MRILVITNYYPPCFIGGYELGCRDVVERLRARGHAITVLTSDFRRADAPPESNVSRTLQLDDDRGRKWGWHLRSAMNFLSAAFFVRPELIYFWNQAGLSLWLSRVARMLRYRRAFFLSDTSFPSWRVGAFLRKYLAGQSEDSFLRWLFGETFLFAGTSVLTGGRCQFASAFLRNLAETEAGAVIHWGIDPHGFPERPNERNDPFRLLYVGQIIPEKGVHTAIAATALILERYGPGSVTLSIVGGSSKPDYLAELKRNVADRGLSDRVIFKGKIARSEIPALYRAHDLLLVPSIWEEPFAITPLEAMASGLPVIATDTGGSAEIFRHRENSLIFPPDNAEACAEAIRELQSDRALYDSIQKRARELVIERFTIEEMVDRIEQDLQEFVR